MEATIPERRWYALRLRSNFEHKTHGYCQGQGLETFLPTYRRASRKHGGPTVLERPLFPGYLFAHFDLRLPEKTALLQAPGVAQIVRFGNKSVAIPEREIESVRILAQPGSAARPHPFLREGMRVQVVAGPFAGAVGVIAEPLVKKKKITFVVTIELLGRAVGVALEPELLEPVV
jgi:transcriptional antiterminator RfaH